MGGGGLGKDFFKISHNLANSLNKFDSHVKIFEKWILNTSLRKEKFLENGEIFEPNWKSKVNRPFARKRLLEYFSKSNKITDHAKFVDEYRKALLRARLE